MASRAACTLTLLIYTPPLSALADGLALSLANILVQFDRREGWLPNAVLMPLLLCGLVAGAALGHSGSTVGGACAGRGRGLALIPISQPTRTY